MLVISLIPKPRYSRPAATNSLDFRIASGSLDARVAGGQPEYLRASATSRDFRIASCQDTDSIPSYSTMIEEKSLRKRMDKEQKKGFKK